MIAGPRHGQGDDVAFTALLRAPPPDRTLAWLSRVLGGADVGLRQQPPSPAGRRAVDAAIERAVHDLAR